MNLAFSILTSHAAAPLAWPSLARGRVASSVGVSLAVDLFVFGLAVAPGAAAER